MRGLPALATLALLPAAAIGTPDLEWAVTYDGGAAYDDFPTAAITDAAGRLVLGGRSYDGDGGCDMIIRAYDAASGDTLWHRRVTSPDGTDMTVTDLVMDGGGNVLVGGHVLGCPG